MPLSEHEQRQLEKIDEELSKADPWLAWVLKHCNIPLLPKRLFRARGEKSHTAHLVERPRLSATNLSSDHPWRDMPQSIWFTGLVLGVGFGTLLGAFSLVDSKDATMSAFTFRTIAFAVVLFIGSTGCINQLRKSIEQRSTRLMGVGFVKVFALLTITCVLLCLVPFIP